MEIGDLIIGLPQSSFLYKHTNEHVICQVIAIKDSEKIIIKVVDLIDPSTSMRYRNNEYKKEWTVEKKYFRRLNQQEINRFLAMRI